MLDTLPIRECPELAVPPAVLAAVRTALDAGRPVLVCGPKVWWSGEVVTALAQWAGVPSVSLAMTLHSDGFPNEPVIAHGMADVATTVNWLIEKGEWPNDPAIPVLLCPRAGYGFGRATVTVVHDLGGEGSLDIEPCAPQ